MDPIRRSLPSSWAGLVATFAILVVALTGAESVPVGAQDGDVNRCASALSPISISVGGHGSVKLKPDTASVVVGVDVIKPTLAAAQEEATQRATAIIAAVTAGGVAEDDVQTANFSVTVIRDYDDDGTPLRIEGFQVSNQVNVTIRDTSRVGAILDAVVAVGANNIYGISFYVEDPSAAVSQARALAMQDARTKADELAAAADMVVCRITSISESYSPPPAAAVYEGGFDEAAGQAVAVPIQAGTNEVVVDVQLGFELK